MEFDIDRVCALGLSSEVDRKNDIGAACDAAGERGLISSLIFSSSKSSFPSTYIAMFVVTREIWIFVRAVAVNQVYGCPMR